MNALDLLADAATNKDSDALREAVSNLKREYEAAPLLAHILLADWHDSHEDIVFELGLIGHPNTTKFIAKAAAMHFAHLGQWNNVQEFQRKYAYALARIGTDESKAALRLLNLGSDPALRQFAQEGLRHWPLSN